MCPGRAERGRGYRDIIRGRVVCVVSEVKERAPNKNKVCEQIPASECASGIPKNLESDGTMRKTESSNVHIRAASHAEISRPSAAPRHAGAGSAPRVRMRARTSQAPTARLLVHATTQPLPTATMGALLSIPMMALPSVGTVSIAHLAPSFAPLTFPALGCRRLVLWSSHLQCRLWLMRRQVWE